MQPDDNLYVVTHKPGAENPAIPVWASRIDNPAQLSADAPANVTRREIDDVPGAFQLLGVTSAAECARLVELTESLGYLKDAAVSLPHSIRHNHSATWIADDTTAARLWARCRDHFPVTDLYGGKRALGLNARFRFYRYAEQDFFSPHTDGAWPGSRVVGGRLVDDAFEDRWSQLTFLLFLSEDFSGGATRFYVDDADLSKHVDLRTPLGAALCFPHGNHPLHCLHASVPIESGVKYILRSDVLFEL